MEKYGAEYAHARVNESKTVYYAKKKYTFPLAITMYQKINLVKLL